MKTEAIFNVTYPLLLLVPLFTIVLVEQQPLAMGYICIGLMIVSVLCLFYARIPLYKQKQFFNIGPSKLDKKHRNWYFFSYICLGISIVLSFLIIT
jgi:hypothetical protein